MKKPLLLSKGIHDISETSNRIYQFGIVALLFTVIAIINDLIYGLTLSACLVAGLFLTMAFTIAFGRCIMKVPASMEAQV